MILKPGCVEPNRRWGCGEGRGEKRGPGTTGPAQQPRLWGSLGTVVPALGGREDGEGRSQNTPGTEGPRAGLLHRRRPACPTESLPGCRGERKQGAEARRLWPPVTKEPALCLGRGSEPAAHVRLTGLPGDRTTWKVLGRHGVWMLLHLPQWCLPHSASSILVFGSWSARQPD